MTIFIKDLHKIRKLLSHEAELCPTPIGHGSL